MTARRRGIIVHILGALALASLPATSASASPEIHVETPAANATVTEPFWLGGWAVDQAVSTGTGVDLAWAQICPGSCTGSNAVWAQYIPYGAPWARQDVVNAYNAAFGAGYGDRFLYSGLYRMVTGIAPGTYQVITSAHSVGSNTWVSDVRTITIATSPNFSLETPTEGQAVTAPFWIGGWAADFAASSGSGIDVGVQAAYPNPGSGAAPIVLPDFILGWTRVDLGNAVNNHQFDPTGAYAWVPSGTLPSGAYLVAAYVHSSVSGAWTVVTRLMYVDQPMVDLIVDRAGTGTGGLSGLNMACAGGATTLTQPCVGTYSQVTQPTVTLTATPDSGSTFVNWGGACTGTAPTCTVTMSEARYVVATFAGAAGVNYALTYYHLDRIGSVRAITDTAGQVVARHDYGPYGEDIEAMPGDPIRFGGKQLDAETGLQDFEARYYRNIWGRFTSVDPVGGSLGDPQSWNRYAYTRNNPLKFVDPTGTLAHALCPFDTCSQVTEPLPLTPTAPPGLWGGVGGLGGHGVVLPEDCHWQGEIGCPIETWGPAWGLGMAPVEGQHITMPLPPACKEHPSLCADIMPQVGVPAAPIEIIEAGAVKFVFGPAVHYAERLAKVGIDVESAQAAVRAALIPILKKFGLEIVETGGRRTGELAVKGVKLRWHIGLRDDGIINVGTIFPPK